GGGVPARAIREFGFLLEQERYPRKLIRRVRLVSPAGKTVALKLNEPFAIFSRQVLNGVALDRAVAAGARFVRAAVTDFSKDGDSWIVNADNAGEKLHFRARFLVGADGAASSMRRKLIGIFPKKDLALAFGYNVDSDPMSQADEDSGRDEEVLVKFAPAFTGYIWAFPRPGVMNFGVAAKLGERSSDELRTMLSRFVSEYYGGKTPDSDRVTFFGAKIPTLDASSWKKLKASGDGWALVGDAAGFCDPITGEGIYYAFKSAQVLGDALERARTEYKRATDSYERAWRVEFGAELERASQLLPRFYRGRIFGQAFTNSMVNIARYHRGTAAILMRLLVGDQSYVTLKRDLKRKAWRIL